MRQYINSSLAIYSHLSTKEINMYRSSNPDLLFYDVMKQRTGITTKWWCCHRGEIPRDFDRFTVFVTHRCNLFCEYCNGPHMKETQISSSRRKEMLHSDLTVESYARLLEDATADGAVIRHVHFTGGEPTLNKGLPRMVEITTGKNFLSSITTNGTTDPAIYRQLIECGLTEVRVSFDSYDAQKFDASVRTKGAFEKVLRGIQEIVQLRDEERKKVFLVLNACVSHTNLTEIEKTLRFLLSLNPNDVKFLVIVQDREYVSAHRDDALRIRLQALLADYPKERFPLLRIKIGQMFDKDMVGLRDNQAQCLMEHCFLPLMERTLDGKYYYPCSIYTRYGDPIGRIEESITEQQRKTEEFVANHDCRKDPICVVNCVNCCKRFNVSVNKDLKQFAGILEVENVSLLEVKRVRSVITSINWRDQPQRRFLIIKPHGMAHRDKVLVALNEMGLSVVSVQTIKEWGEVFTTLFYGLTRPKNMLESTLTHSRAASRVERGSAEVWYLPDDLSFDQLGKAKRIIRDKIPSQVFIVKPVGTQYQERLFHLNAVHTPASNEEAKRQLAVIAYWQQK